MSKLYLLASVSLLAFTLTVSEYFQKFMRSEKTIEGDVLDSWPGISSHVQCMAKCRLLNKCRVVRCCDVNSACVLYESYTIITNMTDGETRNVFTYFKELMSCEPGWSLVGDSCYMLVNITMSWYDAANACNSMGAHLMTITSQAEQQVVLNLRLNPAVRMWIGGKGIPNGTHHEWQWENGEEWQYENFGGKINFDPTKIACLSIEKDSDKWNDRNCNHPSTKSSFICELEVA